MKPAIPIHDPRFVYVPARSHDAGIDDFRERQRARIRAAQEKPANVRNIQRKERKA